MADRPMRQPPFPRRDPPAWAGLLKAFLVWRHGVEEILRSPWKQASDAGAALSARGDCRHETHIVRNRRLADGDLSLYLYSVAPWQCLDCQRAIQCHLHLSGWERR